jgi:hypothetical protein
LFEVQESLSTLASKFIGFILSRIRSHAEETANSNGENLPGSKSGADSHPVSLREAQLSDFDGVCAMNLRLGQGSDSLENWQRLWRDNPALRGGRTPRIGWVLESSGDIVGFLGNIPLLCEFESKTLAAAATCRLAVEPAYRSSTHLLVTSFFRQKDVDLFLNTTATVAAGRIMNAFKARQVPQPDYGKVLFWVLRPRKFMKTVLDKAGLSGPLTAVGSATAALVLSADMVFRHRKPKGHSGPYSVVETSVNEIGPAFEDFWAERAKETMRLFSKRSAAIMHWHFNAPGSAKTARMLGCYSSDRLVGYAVVRHESSAKDGVQRSLIADLMVSPENELVVDTLLAAAHATAKSAGSEVLEVLGFPRTIRESLGKWKPYSRDYPSCPYFYKARDRALEKKLAHEDAWYACPFDGDATLWP